ncbi:peroxidase family protein [Pseudomonas sp. ACN5]|uniref:peroxidase family protein n=1 Tax=Pseudomonas sp. ACN5 TaxID=1920427 RepID=UPI000BB3E636|nr:peroxidase family protein [Pseudomonas sp. ACN5]PBJ02236.1 Bifunctional hemolysin/adenylate cyclase precursor [Pseudomonas sp. ACN5]
MANFNKSDLEFILQQIFIAEADTAGQSLASLIPNPEFAFGLRTVDGTFNNLRFGQSEFGAADNIFPRMTTPVFRPAEAGTSYTQTSGLVIDSQPRTISNLIVDNTANNPAAVAATFDPGLDGILGTVDDVLKDGAQVVTGTRTDGTIFQTFFIPNQSPDVGLSAPFNPWMTFFGQFFDHGLDLVTKGGSGTVFIPLQPDDPLFVPGSPTNFMVLTRATNLPGPDGILGTADDIHEASNTTTPFVDQNQTYSSHPSHQVFLRAYELDAAGKPVATGKLITNRDLGADGLFGTADDVEIGGMATWKVVKAQARDMLGIDLDDLDVLDLPLLATDAYGNFIRGANGFAQIVTATGLVEGNPLAPIDASLAIRTGHQFLIDIAHNASPVDSQTGAPLTADADLVAGGPVAAGSYDNELLDAHYIAGDGRVNENIGLTTVHAIFHSEHNRLVQQTKDTVLASAAAGDLTFLNQWLLTPVTAVPADLSTLNWNGERLFQAAKFGTEMQYQHLVFEEFARTIQPQVDAFLDFDDTINPSIVAEFAHTVFRFGHSMLTETIDRLDPNFTSSEIGLIQAFLNPLAFAASGPTPEQAAGAIVRGLTRQVGNEIDEFVTEAVRNNLLGLPLDLPALNIARGRDTGIPSLNAARREFYAGTGDSQLKPYTSWVDLVQHLKHPESLINFIAAYGTHASITSATTLDAKRAAATLLVLGGVGEPVDRLDFLHSTGVWANNAGADGIPNTADDFTISGVDAIDFWIGGLAEEKMPFGGMLGSTFNFVFEDQLEKLQSGDRLYYLHRTQGLNFLSELENNSFAKMVMLNTDATHLPGLIFSTPTWTLEVDPTLQHTGLGVDGRADPTGGMMINGVEITPLVIRDNPATIGPDTNYLQYTGEDHVVLGGTAGNDILVSGDGDDTLWGDAGNDRLEGGYGNDEIEGGDGDDIITDMGGDDVIHGGAGNDVIHGGNGINIILGGAGNDFIVTGEDFSEVFGGAGDDFMLGSRLNGQMMGGDGDDWIEVGTQDGSPGDNFAGNLPLALLEELTGGNDVFSGDGGFDEMIGEGGDDIFIGSEGPDKMLGMSGFDWATYKDDRFGVTVDMTRIAFEQSALSPSVAGVHTKFPEVEGLSGSAFSDMLTGDDADALAIAAAGVPGSVLTNIDLVNGLRAFLGAAAAGPDGIVGTADDQFGAGNILLGGGGSDIIEGRGGDDLVDGDMWLNVRISVRQNLDGTGPEIATFDSMEPMIPFMLDGTFNPGQLVIVREILTDAPAFDTALFTGNQLDYTVTTVGGVTTVVDSVVGRDGTDRLTNIERLQFNDQSLTLPGGVGLNNDPLGLLTILDAASNTPDATPTTGQLLRVSAADVTDADNAGGAITGPIAFYWQFEAVPGTGVFQDITRLADGGAALAHVTGPTFRVTPDLAGLELRVRAVYKDQNGVLETAFSAPTAAVVAGVAPPPAAPLPAETPVASTGVHYIRADLQFILDQILISERNAAGEDLLSMLPNARLPLGLRTVDGSFNNLVAGQNEFGAANTVFPRLVPAQFDTAEAGTSYAQTSGLVTDSQPRTISNLIADNTASNPAAVAATFDPGLDGILGTVDDVLKDGAQVITGTRTDGTTFQTFFMPNQSPDVGLSAPFNPWMTFFGQFFDHGLDLVTKGGSGTVFIPLQPDDPLFVPGSPTNFMVLTRATNLPGPDGILGTADDIHEASNTTTPFVDQNQTYTSHPSHQVFLRAYEFNAAGDPVATGRLITNRDLGADGLFGTADDVEIGGMATWKVVKAQARDLLGINLTDADFDNVPLLATDAYGNFIKGPNGFPMVMMRGPDGIADTADDVLVEGNPAAPISLVNAVRTGHQFLIDIAHSAVPVDSQTGAPLTADADLVAGGPVAAGFYDNELLDAHYIAGDGRVNENIGLTTVHAIFHSEHNRLVQHTKDVAIASNDVNFLNQWLMPDAQLLVLPTTAAEIAALHWNGERLFQAARFGTEMQYQHLVFEEFARTIQPNIDPFLGEHQNYQTEIDPAIVAEFAHAVYRLGHSMLTETIDRLDPNFASSEIGLIQAFLNPLAFAASGPTPEQAAGAIVRGLTRQVGNEIDEFVTEAVRNNLLGLPLDLPAINIARGRDTGIPTLNEARREFYTATGDSNLKPYISWADLVQHLKHPESLINFIAAYGTHASITSATTLDGKRAAASLLVLGGAGEPADRLDFLNSTGAWASGPTGVTITGLDNIDLWIGGLAEEKMPFGGMLGSTFNFVFETQMEKLQNADRFYYLERNAGLNFVTELENNSFARLVMANTDATHLPAVMFLTPAFTLEVDPARQFNESVIAGPDGIVGTIDDLPGNTDPVGGILLTPLVIRDNPATVGPDTNYLQYTGEDHVVLGGSAVNDILVSGDGDDTLYGDGANDRLEGGYGNDFMVGGDGDDIITDMGGDDTIHGGDGNDVIHSGSGVNLNLGGLGKDFIVTGEDSSEVFGGAGDDFIMGSLADEQLMGNEGDDWIERGTADGAPGDNFDPNGLDLIRGNDIFIGTGAPDRFMAEGGDDIMFGNGGAGDRYLGGSGYDWAGFKDDPFGVSVDLSLAEIAIAPPLPELAATVARFQLVEGLTGSHFSDILRGDDADATVIAAAGAQGSVLTNFDLVSGLRSFVGTAAAGPDGIVGTADDQFGAGNIVLGGGGSDIIEGGGGDDLVDGDKWLNVRISVRQNIDGTGPEIATFDSMLQLEPFMLSGTYNPGQLVAVREILTDAPDPLNPGHSFDTALYTGLLADYTVIENADGTITVADSVVGRDGTDRLSSIERLQFADQSVVLVNGLNAEPVGLLRISDGTPAVGQVLTVLADTVSDADNVTAGGTITGPIAFVWQVETNPGTGIFDDIGIALGGGLGTATGSTFTVTAAELGLALRVRAIYQDGHGVLESIFSAPTAPTAPLGGSPVNLLPVGTVLISDTSPTEGSALTATDAFTDANGVGVVTHQWQVGGIGVPFTDIAGATGLTFTPTQAQVGLSLRVVASFTDGLGTLEQVFSAPTTVVGDVIVGTAGADILTGTAGDDVISGGDGNDILNGLGGNDILNGDAGNDVLIGGLGADTMVGGAGNDIYEVTDAGDVVTELAGGGIDEVWTSLTRYTLSADVENLFFGGSGNFAGSGNVLDNTIVGGAGNDILIGAAGADIMVGGGGNDIYEVTDLGDQVIEFAGGGGDTVWTSLASYSLGANVENLFFGGSGNFAGNGNELANTIAGGAGNDVLVGGAGADMMVGGGGSDIYEVTDLGDQAVELAGAGIDTVWTSLASYTLSANVENLFFGGSGNFVGTGNELANMLVSAAGNDVLIGNGGADTMVGGAGSDVYEVTDLGDVVGENAGGGNDTIWTSLASYTLDANVENLFFGGNGNFVGTGNGLANTIVGGAGNDFIVGAGGNDVMSGGVAGNDTFVFGAAGFGNDTILNFSANPAAGQDLLDLRPMGITSATFAPSLTITANGADTVVGIGADSIRLVGVNSATVDQTDFILAT